MSLLLFAFGSVKQLPQSCCQQKAAKQFFYHRDINSFTEQCEACCADTTADNGGQNGSNIQFSLTPAEEGSNDRCGDKEQQIDCSGSTMFEADHQRKPKNQKTASAYAESC